MRGAPWCLLAGTLLFHGLPQAPSPPWSIALLAVALIGTCLRCVRWLVVVALGFAWVWLHAELRLAERLPEAYAGVAVHAEGMVRSLPQQRGDDAVRFLFEVHLLEGRRLPLRARVIWYRPPSVLPAPGEIWQLHVRLRRPRGFANPGGFDYEGWLFRERIGATGYVLGDREARRLEAAGGRCLLLRLRAQLARRLTALAPHDPSMALAVALAVGIRDGLSDAQWEILGLTGAAHLMAISGLHVGLVAGLALVAVRRLWGWVPRLAGRVAPVDAGLAGAFLAASVYAVLAGLSVPTRRALIMLSVVLGARALRREIAPGQGLGRALVAVLLLDPMAPLAASFWLSFVAVAAILYGQQGRGAARPWRWLRVQWVVWLGLAPVSLWVFDRISLLAPLVNLVLIPLFALLVVPAVLAAVMLVGAAPGLSRFPLELALSGLGLVWPALERLAELPWVSWSAAARPLWTLLAMQLGAVLLLAPRGLPGRWLGLLCLLPVLSWRPEVPARGAFELAVLDVGQGLAAVVRTSRHTLVYDTGPAFASGGDAASVTLLPFMRSRGIEGLDLLVVSHGDGDHRGGVASLVAAYPPARTLTGGGQDWGAPCAAGESWTWDGVHFEILHPPAGESWTGNDGSCVLRVSAPGGSALLTGDIEAQAERAIVASGLLRGSDIVIGPHHGSETSSSVHLVERCLARYVVFAAGHENRWGFPRRAVIARWRRQGAETLETATAGAVIFRVDVMHGVGEPYVHRDASRRYWSAPRARRR